MMMNSIEMMELTIDHWKEISLFHAVSSLSSMELLEDVIDKQRPSQVSVNSGGLLYFKRL